MRRNFLSSDDYDETPWDDADPPRANEIPKGREEKDSKKETSKHLLHMAYLLTNLAKKCNRLSTTLDRYVRNTNDAAHDRLLEDVTADYELVDAAMGELFDANITNLMDYVY